MSYLTDGKKPITVGPWGGYGGAQFDDGVYTGIRELVVVHGAAIDSIQIEYDRKGSPVWSDKHGGSGGPITDKIKLEYPDEVLTSISGYYGSIVNGSPVVVRSLTLESNRAKYGPYGFQQGTHFSFPMTGGRIVGFHGRCGWYLDSVGVHLKSHQKSDLSNSLLPYQMGYNVVQGSVLPSQMGYNVVPGSVGRGYDIVLAVREKEDNNRVSWNSFSKQSSDTKEFTSLESQSTVVSFPSSSVKEPPSYIVKEPSTIGGPVTYGPWGGNGGIIFDDGTYTGVRQVNLTRNVGIVSMKVLYDKNGQAIWGNKHGGNSGLKTEKIIFDYPYEVLTHISGYYGPALIMGPTTVNSLTFHTTKRKYGPFGDEQGMFFTSNMKAGMIVGFHGRKGWCMDSIGVHVLEGKLSLPQPSLPNTLLSDAAVSEVDNPQWSNKLMLARRGLGAEEVAYSVIKEPVPSGPGPWGGDGGRPWDDGVFSGIKQIFITRGQAITSIQVEYDRNGQSVWSTKHGAGGGETTHKIPFAYPNEVLNCICGYYSSINRDERPKVITSLTFYTTRGKYGPYGEEIGTFFTSTTTEGKNPRNPRFVYKSLHPTCTPFQLGTTQATWFHLLTTLDSDLLVSQMSYLTDGKKPITVGPWGGHGGAQFDDGVYTGIMGLVVVHGAAIDSIQIQYDKKGSPVWSDKHGGSGGTKTDKIKLEYPDEVLTSISGYHGSIVNGSPVVVRSLTLESNRAKYGPYGFQQGTHFSFPMTDGRIVGFHGRCGWYLDSIGVYLKSLLKSDLSNSLLPSQMGYNVVQGSVGRGYDPLISQMSHLTDGKKPITAGPWGGHGGAQFDDGVYTGIRELVVVHGAAIDSIQIQYDKNGSPVWSDKHGGSGGTRTDKIKLEYPDEVLTSISGYYGSIFNGSPIVVRSLTLESNRAKYGPYGFQQGTHFSFPMTGDRIVGFHGRCGWYLDSIGVYLKSLLNSDLSNSLLPSQMGYNVVQGCVLPSQMGYNVVQGSVGRGYDPLVSQMSYLADGKKPITVGPWGGYGGAQFDDGVYTGIRKLVVVHGAAIDSIQIQYDKKGNPVWSDKHGGSGGTRTEKIKLEYPDEVLTSISGYYGSIVNGSPVVVRSLTLESNRAKYGPYGFQQGTHFSFPMTDGRIVGFHGRLMLAKKGLGAEEVAYSVIKEPVPSGPEPWGGDGGRPWDDGVFSGIKQISLQGDKQLLQYSLSMTEMGNLFGLPNMELAVERPHIR
ncbi:hypothetical protein AAC387_Pa02g3093 [Persea americana]